MLNYSESLSSVQKLGGASRPSLTGQSEEDIFLLDAQGKFYENVGVGEGAVLCFFLCYLDYVPTVSGTSLKKACNKNVLITSHLFPLSSFSAAVSF